MGRLDGKVAIVTGGASGIGLATGKLFAQEGAKVLLVDIQEEALKRAVEAFKNDGVSYVVADVSQPQQTERFVQTAVTLYGGIDIFIANAGILGSAAPIPDYPIDVFDRVLAVNVRGVWLGIKFAIPEIQKRGGGSIVITSSIAGVKGSPTISAYCTSKHALVGLMRSAAIECGPVHIRVNTVHPGPIETPMIHLHEEGVAPGAPEQGKKALKDGTLLKRYAAAEEVAGMMLYLCSDEGSFCTGHIYMIDGGKAVT